MQPSVRALLGGCCLYISLISCASGNRPSSINCELGPWTPWTPCDDCTEEKWRYRPLARASQFGGSPCGARSQMWDKRACPTATGPCLVPNVCRERLTCDVSERCVSQELRCNGEMDCQEGTDEDDCPRLNLRHDKCSSLHRIPGAERAIRGYNILTGDFMYPVLDPEYFGGQCEYVYNGEWRKFSYETLCESLEYNAQFKNFRKPYNYHTYRFLAQAKAEGSSEYYNDASSLVNARQTYTSANFGVTASVFYVEVGLEASHESEFLTKVTEHNSQELGFVRLWSQVQTARFTMRSNGLMLNEDMHRSLKELPDDYNPAMYLMFLNTYGTHYVTEGTMGGTMETILVVNKTTMKKSNTDGQMVANCFGASIGIQIPVYAGLTVGPKVSGKLCDKHKDLDKKNSSDFSEIKDVIRKVKGGLAETSPHLLTINNPESFMKWGQSLPYDPALIEYETMPIYELVRLSTAGDYLSQKLVHLRRAFDEYQLQFSPCRCAPCRHNGIPVLKGTSCSCICPGGYLGPACEQTNRPDRRTDGQWSCWGAWPTCQAGRKTRTRACNNPAPDMGGANCLGSSSQNQPC